MLARHRRASCSAASRARCPGGEPSSPTSGAYSPGWSVKRGGTIRSATLRPKREAGTRSRKGRTGVGKTPRAAARRARKPMATRMLPGTSRAPAARSLRGILRKETPKARTKAVTAVAAVSARSAPGDGHDHLRPGIGDGVALEHRLQDHPLAEVAVERRHHRDGQGRHQEEARGPRHQTDQTAQPVQLPGAGGVVHRTRAEKQEPFVDRVVQHVVQGGDGRQGRQHRQVVGLFSSKRSQ